MKKIHRNLTILKVKDNTQHDKRFNDLDERLPKPPFRMLLNAPSQSGKSNVIQNLIFNKNFYADNCFDTIVFVSPTIFEDTTAKHMPQIAEYDEKLVLRDDPDNLDSIIDKLVEYQTEHHEENEHILLIMDDCISNINKSSAINKFIMKARHYRISIIIATQYYRAVDARVRENCNAYLLFLNHSHKEIEKVHEEIGNKFKNFEEYYDYATDQPFSFLYVNIKKGQLYKKFDELLVDKMDNYYKPISDLKK
jgi:hypothetical protein